jgi:hypothetical protein
VERGAALPPAGVIIVFGDLVEAELLVVVGADPFGGVDGALFKRRIDVAAGELLRNATEFGKRLAGPTADTHLQSAEVGRLLDFLVEPTAHLTAGVAADERICVELLGEVDHQFRAVAVVIPGILLAGVERKWRGAEQRPGRILADKIIGGGVAGLDGPVLHGVEHLQSGHDFAGGESLNLEFVVGRLGNVLGKCFASSERHVERLRPACGQAPFDLGRGLGNRGCGQG